MISREELEQLIEYSDGPMLSVYMPVERPGTEISQNPIRLKNQIDQAEAKLRQQGMTTGDILDFLKPLNDLLTSLVFWQEQQQGLALFHSTGRFLTYQASIRFPEQVYLNNHFYTRPMIDLLESGTYYILALNLSHTRLFRATRYEIQEMDLGDTPTSLKETTKYDVAQRDLQYHNETPARRLPGRNATFFGQGGSEENDKKEDILRFFQILDREIVPRIGDRPHPMVLAGLEYLLPIYRSANHYSHLYQEDLRTNVDGMNAEDLHAATWQMVKPFFQQARQGALDEYHIYARKKQASKDIREIVPASFVGQVETLLITRDTHIWGSFHPEKLRAEVYPGRVEGNEDLVDTAVANTLRTGGTIYCYEPVEMPDGARIAAVLRYPLDGIDYKNNK